MRQGLVISDLHLFSRRSRAEELLTEIDDQIASAEILVLNGDVFDFRWSVLPDMQATIDGAMKWMDTLMEKRSGKPTHYLLGNHDCVAGFMEALSAFAESRPSVHWHESFLRIGNNLFLHGDCANRRMDSEAHRRFRDAWSRDQQRGPTGRLAVRTWSSRRGGFGEAFMPESLLVCSREQFKGNREESAGFRHFTSWEDAG